MTAQPDRRHTPGRQHAGSIVNTGTIVAKTGISILDSTIEDAIVEGGRIVAANFGANGVLVSGGGDVFGGIQIGSHGAISAFSGIKVFGATALGGITNSGIVVAGRTGVNISGVTTLSGGIINRGTITAGTATLAMGIAVTQVNVFGDSSAGGGITNTGTISAAFNAIQLQSVATFAGAIVNSGKAGGGDRHPLRLFHGFRRQRVRRHHQYRHDHSPRTAAFFSPTALLSPGSLPNAA